jgi:hypothetical protein
MELMIKQSGSIVWENSFANHKLAGSLKGFSG